MRPALKAHRWDVCLVVALAVGLVGYLSRTSFVSLPFIQEQLPAPLLVAVVAVVVAITPLYPVFANLAPTLARERTNQRIRPLGSITLALVGFLPAVVAVPGSGSDGLFFLALLAVALLAIMSVGELAWAIVLAAGFAVLLVDTAPGAPVTRLLEAASVWGLSAAVAACALLVAAFGARRWRVLA